MVCSPLLYVSLAVSIESFVLHFFIKCGLFIVVFVVIIAAVTSATLRKFTEKLYYLHWTSVKLLSIECCHSTVSSLFAFHSTTFLYLVLSLLLLSMRNYLNQSLFCSSFCRNKHLKKFIRITLRVIFKHDFVLLFLLLEKAWPLDSFVLE